MSDLQRLFLLRHAEALPASLDIRDFDRPLSDTGKIEAKKIGTIIKENYTLPEDVVLSPSKRTQQTVNFLHHFNSKNLNIANDIYNGDIQDYLKILNDMKHSTSLLLVGHNPAVFMLFQFLVAPKSKVKIPRSYPPAGLAIIDFPNKSKALKQYSGQLIAFHSP